MNYPAPLNKNAFCGQIFFLINAIYPHTEADEAALLSQLIVGFGNLIGRSPHYEVEATRHGTNLFALNIGISSKGRKGTSWARIKDILSDSDPEWLSNQVLSGLSSGEGLIWKISDKASDDIDKPQPLVDKRLLCLESEFASVLKVAAREGNTLSPIIRNAWDGTKLSSLTKNHPMSVSDPHISIIGHITPTELIRFLNMTEMYNGLGNRFLYFCVKRSKSLPEGGNMPEDSRNECRDYLKAAAAFAKNVNQIKKSQSATELWRSIYEDLSGERWGIAGHLLSRAEATVIRLAMIIALINMRDEIQVIDLEAALEIWRYNEESVLYIFGNKTGNVVADEILTELEARSELTRTEIRDLFRRNRSSAEIENGLRELESSGKIERLLRQSGGRSAEIIKLVEVSHTTKTTLTTEGGINDVNWSYMSLMS